MKRKAYQGPERRRFIRLDYIRPFAYKVCKERIIHKLLKGYISNISQSGLFCNIENRVKRGDILWLSFDRDTLSVCEGVEKRSFIYQAGIIGKVVRIIKNKGGSYNVGIQFITREEKNLTHIYPKAYFLEKQQRLSEAKQRATDKS